MLQKNSTTVSNNKVPALQFEHVNKQFANAGYKALDDITLSIDEGEFVTILGTSGCGKTTLVKTVNRLYEPDSGEILLFGKNIKDSDPIMLRRSIGYVIQQAGLFPHMTVYENVALMKELKKDIMPVDNVLDQVGLLVHKKKFPHQLSGGEQQRVSIARAVVKNPEILLCDEPTGALDSDTGAKVLKLLHDMCKEYHKTTIIVTHNTNLQAIADKVIRVKNGQINTITTNSHPLDVMEVEW